jgi:hypothetical protein
VATPNTAHLVNGETSALARCTPVRVNDDGEIVAASRDGDETARVFGLVRETSIAAGEQGRVIVSGTLSATLARWDAVTGASGGLTTNRSYYLGATGKLTDVEGGTRIGVALSAYTMALHLGESSEAAVDTDEGQDGRIEVIEGQMRELVLWMVHAGFPLPENLVRILED